MAGNTGGKNADNKYFNIILYTGAVTRKK